MVLRELVARLGLQFDDAGFAAAEGAINMLKRGLTVAGATAGAAAVALAAAAKTTANTANQIDSLSKRTGVSTDVLQELAYAGQFSNVSMEELAATLGFMARKGVKDLRGELYRVADQLAAMPDESDRLRYAMEKLGRSTGQQLVNMLSDGSARLRELGKEARWVGYILDKNTIKSGAALNDSLDALQASAMALVWSIGAPLLTPLKAVALAMRDWIAENRELIATNITNVVSVLGNGLKLVWRMLDRIARIFGGWNRIIKVVGAALLFYLGHTTLLRIVALGKGIIAAAAAMASWAKYLWMMRNIIMASVAAGWASAKAGAAMWSAWLLGGIVVLALLEDIYYWATGGESLLQDFWVWLGEFVPVVMQHVVDALGALWSGFWESMYWWFKEDWDRITNLIKQADQVLSDFFWGIVSDFTGGFKMLFDGIKEIIRLVPGGELALKTAGDLFGGGASPGASAALRPGVGGAIANNNSTANNTINVSVNAAPGMSTSQLANESATRVDEALARKAAQARAQARR